MIYNVDVEGQINQRISKGLASALAMLAAFLNEAWISFEYNVAGSLILIICILLYPSFVQYKSLKTSALKSDTEENIWTILCKEIEQKKKLVSFKMPNIRLLRGLCRHLQRRISARVEIHYILFD